MPDWPISMPRALSRSLSVVPRDIVWAFQPDEGEPLTKPKSTAELVDYSFQLFLIESLREELKNFHKDNCAFGSLSFTMNDPIGGLLQTWKWVNPPSFNQAGPSGYWYATVSLVRLPE